MPQYTIYPRTHVIRRTKTWSRCKALRGHSVSTQRVKLIRDGITVDEYLNLLKQAGLPSGLGDLQYCKLRGYVTVT